MTQSDYDKARMKVWIEVYAGNERRCTRDAALMYADAALEDFERRFPKGDLVEESCE